MFLVGIELTKFVQDIKRQEIFLLLLTALLSLFINMAIGFVAGLFAYHVLKKFYKIPVSREIKS
jgi:hypothetical protein